MMNLRKIMATLLPNNIQLAISMKMMKKKAQKILQNRINM